MNVYELKGSKGYTRKKAHEQYGYIRMKRRHIRIRRPRRTVVAMECRRLRRTRKATNEQEYQTGDGTRDILGWAVENVHVLGSTAEWYCI